MKHTYLFVLSLLLFALLLVACGGQAETPTAVEPAGNTTADAAPEEVEEEETAPEEEAGAGSISVIMTGPWDDGSWNESAYDALKALEAEGVRIAYSENVSDADASRILRQYVSDGYRLNIGHSFSFQDAVFEVAEESADTTFAWAGGIGRTAANVADYDQPFYEAAYPIGVLAGHLSESGTLGALYGFDIPVCHAMGEAFLAGARSVNPDATLITTAVGDWADVARAKEAALAQADSGVDYWIECGEGPALGAIEAAKEVGGYVTGYVGDMSELGPDVVLASIVWNLEPLFRQMLADTLSGNFDNPHYRFGVAEGAMLVGYNEGLQAGIPADALADVQAAIDAIASGELEVPFVPE
jgi:basic membrane protein A and related proteins